MQYNFQTKKLKKKGGESIIFTFIQRLISCATLQKGGRKSVLVCGIFEVIAIFWFN
jgi:hypothetical protein